MQNIVSDVSEALDTIEQVNTIEITPHIMTTIVIVFVVISFVVSLYNLYRTIDKRIDERIDARIRPSTELLQDTVQVVKKLEKNTAEMNATLSVLRDLLLSHSELK